MDDLKEILAAATPGPWRIGNTDPDRGIWVGGSNEGGGAVLPYLYFGHTINWPNHYKANARLIAMAPDLAAEVLRLRAALAVFADTKSYLTNGPCDPDSPKFSALKIARAALKTKGAE